MDLDVVVRLLSLASGCKRAIPRRWYQNQKRGSSSSAANEDQLNNGSSLKDKTVILYYECSVLLLSSQNGLFACTCLRSGVVRKT
jgi:hypothetical protein